MARDHLADQAEREELESDDDEQHAERQKRATADRVPQCLVDGEVDEDADPDRHQRESEPAEEVQRSMAVPADERDGQEIEEPAQVALDPVTRPPVLPLAMVHRKLCNAKAAVVREDGDEAVQLAVQTKS